MLLEKQKKKKMKKIWDFLFVFPMQPFYSFHRHDEWQKNLRERSEILFFLFSFRDRHKKTFSLVEEKSLISVLKQQFLFAWIPNKQLQIIIGSIFFSIKLPQKLLQISSYETLLRNEFSQIFCLTVHYSTILIMF